MQTLVDPLEAVRGMADNLRAGLRVRLHSLQAATHHNDAEGHLLNWNDSRGRWDVRLSSGEVLAVRPANLGMPGGMAGMAGIFKDNVQAAEADLKFMKDAHEGAMQFADSEQSLLRPGEKKVSMSLVLPYSAADFDLAKVMKFENAISAAMGASAEDVKVGQVTEMRSSTVRIDATIKVAKDAKIKVDISGDVINTELRQQGLLEMVRGHDEESYKSLVKSRDAIADNIRDSLSRGLLVDYKNNGWTPVDDQAWSNDMLAALKNAERHEKVIWEIEIAHSADDHRDVLKRADEGLAVAEELRSSRPEAASWIYRMLGDSFSTCGDQVKSLELLEQSKTLAVEAAARCPCAPCRDKVSTVLHSLGCTRLAVCEYAKAIDDFEQAKKIHVELGHRDREAGSLQNLGQCYLLLEQYEKAMEVLEQSLAMHEELSDKYEQVVTLLLLGRCLSGHGQHNRAVNCLRRAWAVSEEIKENVKIQPVSAQIAMVLGQARWAQARAGHLAVSSDATSAGGISTSDADTLQDAERWLKTALELAKHAATNVEMDATVHLACFAFFMGNEDQAVDLLAGYLRFWTLMGPHHCAACMQGFKKDAPMLTCTGCGVARSLCSAKPLTCGSHCVLVQLAVRWLTARRG